VCNAQISAVWNSSTTGTLAGVPFSMTNINVAGISSYGFNTADFSVAPLSANQQCITYQGASDWTITFSNPVTNLRIYAKWWRTDTYAFNQNFNILSGSGFTSDDTTAIISGPWGNGVIEFAGPLTTLTVDASQPGGTYQVMTFGSCNNTTASINATVCDSYIVPSGHKTYTTSGVYIDTIPNFYGCDSIITINLTVKHSSVSSITETVCNSYTSPSGITLTTCGIYTDTIPNAIGCDSIITINLTVYYTSAFAINETVCNSYISPSGKTYTTSGVYMDTIPNASGCDSVITINLTVNYSSPAAINETACNSYTAPGGVTYTTSGVYMDTIPNAIGCDSVITINLTVYYTSVSAINEMACFSYTVPSGDETYFTSGVYMDTIPNVSGCDSIITINLTVNNASASTIYKTACFKYTVPSGDETYTTSGIYKDTIPNVSGCDSVITIHLSILTVDASVTVINSTLTASTPYASYQWLNCNNNYTKLLGENGQSYTAPVNGKYAVEVTKFGCADTSACYTIVHAGIVENDFGTSLTVFPNPMSGILTVDLGQTYSDVTVTIKNIAGQTVSSYNYETASLFNCEVEGSPGVYMLEIFTVEGKTASIKILKE